MEHLTQLSVIQQKSHEGKKRVVRHLRDLTFTRKSMFSGENLYTEKDSVELTCLCIIFSVVPGNQQYLDCDSSAKVERKNPFSWYHIFD